MAQRRIPCEIQPSVWRFLAGALYKDRRSIIREAISNACDAINERAETEPRCDKLINIITQGSVLGIEDTGTGIVDLDRFTFISVPNTSKRVIQKGRIGAFGVGKTSYLLHSQSESVDFESVTDTVGMRLNLRPDEEDRLTYSTEYCDRDLLMDHRGLKVRIKDVPKDRRMPVPKLVEYIGLTFAPKIALDKYDIKVQFWENNTDHIPHIVNVREPNHFNKEYTELFDLSDGSNVIGNIQKGVTSGRVEAYKKGVRIEPLDFGYKIKPISWINLVTDGMEQTGGRDSFKIDSPLYGEFEDKMLFWLLQHDFELVDKPQEPRKKNTKQLANVTLDHLTNYFKNNPTDTPPDFAKDMKNKLQINAEEGGGKKETTLTKLSGDRNKGIGSGGVGDNQQPKRKYKKHKHKRPYLKKSGSIEGDGTPKIEYVHLLKGLDPLVKFDKQNQWFAINIQRPSWIMFNTNTLYVSKVAQNEIARAVIRCMPDNETLSAAEMDRKYYDLIDMGVRS